MRRIRIRGATLGTLAALAVLCMMPSTARAQEPASETLVPGRRSITFNFLDAGTASFGIWKMRNQTTNLGILVDVSITHQRTTIEGDDNDRRDTSISLGVGPEVRRYRSVSNRVAPYGFLGGRIGFNWGRTVIEPMIDEIGWGAALSGRIGLGVDFFPVANLSVGAQTGIGASFLYRPVEGPADVTDIGFALNTFGASLGGAIWF